MTADPYAHLTERLTALTTVPGLDQLGMGAAVHEPTAAQRAATGRPQPTERVVYLPGPGGTSVPVLAEHYQAVTTASVAPEPHDAPAAAAERDKWPLRMLTGGASTAMVLGVLGHYGPQLSQAGHGAEMAGIGIAATAGGVGLLVSLVKAGTSRKNPAVTVNVTNHVNSSSTSRSASRSRSR